MGDIPRVREGEGEDQSVDGRGGYSLLIQCTNRWVYDAKTQAGKLIGDIQKGGKGRGEKGREEENKGVDIRGRASLLIQCAQKGRSMMWRHRQSSSVITNNLS